MIVGFDWEGTLDVNPILREMATRLQATGAQVWIISAMPENRPNERERAIEQGNTGIPYRVVYHALDNYHVAAGEAKIKLMKELGIELYVDDNPEVVATLRAAGFKVLHI